LRGRREPGTRGPQIQRSAECERWTTAVLTRTARHRRAWPRQYSGTLAPPVLRHAGPTRTATRWARSPCTRSPSASVPRPMRPQRSWNGGRSCRSTEMPPTRTT
jgi:hypothetical protein